MKRAVSAERRQEGDGAAEILTSDEQERLLQELRDSMASQNRTIRAGFSVIFSVVAAIYCFCFVSFAYEPWSLVHQQRFEFIVAAPALMGYYAVSCYVFVLSTVICQRGRKMVHPAASATAIIGSLACFLGWSVAFYGASVNNVLLYWLPLGPLGGVTIAYYVDGDIAALAEDMVALETKKYNLKDV